MTAGLYIHIPFCTIRCGYCAFFTVTNQEDKIADYALALKHEIDIYAELPEWQNQTFATLYFGGGTPSLLSPSALGRLIEHAQKRFHFSANIEITVETNPNTVDLDKLAGFKEAGINRISFGVQSLNEKELAFLDRDHSDKESIAAFENARKAGFENISLDLIHGLPGQTLSDWQTTLTGVAELEPEHISAYCLTYEEGTPLSVQMQKSKFKPAPEENQRKIQLEAINFLAEKGLLQYEISNFARPGFHSKHNTKYWDGSHYLGIGTSAHSFDGERRFWNVRNLPVYLEALGDKTLAIEGQENLTEEQIVFEQIYLGLRQTKGLNLEKFKAKTAQSFFLKYENALAKFFVKGIGQRTENQELLSGQKTLTSKLLEIQDGHLRLTREGILLSDSVFAEFV